MTKKYVIVYQPWDGEPRVASYLYTLVEALEIIEHEDGGEIFQLIRVDPDLVKAKEIKDA